MYLYNIIKRYFIRLSWPNETFFTQASLRLFFFFYSGVCMGALFWGPLSSWSTSSRIFDDDGSSCAGKKRVLTASELEMI